MDARVLVLSQEKFIDVNGGAKVYQMAVEKCTSWVDKKEAYV